jgi:hypothetical protein
MANVGGQHLALFSYKRAKREERPPSVEIYKEKEKMLLDHTPPADGKKR